MPGIAGPGSARNDGLNWPHCDGLNWPHLRPMRGLTVRRSCERGAEGAEGVGSRVEQFEQIRRDRDREGLSIRALAERHGVHRRAVRQALASPVPPAKRAPVSRPAPKLGAYRALIDAWLERRSRGAAQAAPHGEADLAAPGRRARRRGRRDDGPRLRARAQARDGLAGRGGVRAAGPRAGRRGRGRLGPGARSMLGGRAHDGASVLDARVASRARRSARRRWSRPSRRSWSCTSRRSSGSAACSREVRYDNLSSAVKQVLKGRRRVETDRFVALRSHYLFESQFTTPGLQGAHEKGGVEGEVGRFRRNHLVPVPRGRRPRRAQRAAARRLRGRTWRGGSSGAPATVGEALGDRAAAAARAARRAVRRGRGRGAARRREVAGHGPPEPLLGPGRARRAEGQRPDRRARDHDQPRRPAWSRATSGCTAASAPAPQLDHYLELLRAQARRPGALARARPGTRARRLARLLRRAVGGAGRPLRALGGRRGRWSTS